MSQVRPRALLSSAYCWCVLTESWRDSKEPHTMQIHGVNPRSNLPEQRPDRSTFYHALTTDSQLKNVLYGGTLAL